MIFRKSEYDKELLIKDSYDHLVIHLNNEEVSLRLNEVRELRDKIALMIQERDREDVTQSTPDYKTRPNYETRPSYETQPHHESTPSYDDKPSYEPTPEPVNMEGFFSEPAGEKKDYKLFKKDKPELYY